MSEYKSLKVKIWGEFACFTRPEMKVERVSYDVITPSAARGVLEAIFWKPEFSWRVQRIDVLQPIRRMSFLRNELNTKLSKSIKKPFYADDDRTQRHTLALRDVEYVVHADVHLRPHAGDQHPAKYRDQFRRRVARGQCYHRPYLGCREFSANFTEPDGDESPLDITTDLGRMLFDMKYPDDSNKKKKNADPVFFNARLENGSLVIPQNLYNEVEGQQ